MNFAWDNLPGALESKLLLGTTGKMHLASLARAALTAESFVSMGADMLLAAWEADPLDGMLAGQLVRFLPENDPSGLRALFAGLAERWEPDEDVVRLRQQQKADAMLDVLEHTLQGDSPTLFALQCAVELGPAHHPVSWASGFFERAWPEALSPALEYARSFLDLLAGDAEHALDRCRGIRSRLPLPGVLARIGECEYRLGNPDRALESWRQALAQRPWDVSLLLKVHDVAHGLDRAVHALDGGVNIFLYTFDKAAELDQCLAALAESELHGGRITVLDNGCADDTAAVLDTWAANLGGDRFKTVTLPVNVGAPAARNWLMRGPDAASRDWTVYLDDDALVPPDWLGRLGAAARAYPDAGAWGCRVVDARLPHVIQNADLHPRPDYAREGEFPSGETSDLHHQTYDAGGFSYLRPCASVTGCCHLFRTETLLASGDFDLAFSPSQFDDLDHDLCLVMDGRIPVYQGHLAVRHMKRTGNLAQQGGMAYISGQANHAKLKAKHAENWERLRRLAYDALARDIMLKDDALAAG